MKKDQKAAAAQPAKKETKAKKDKQEIPPGYEDAPEVGEEPQAKAAKQDKKAPAAKAAKAQKAVKAAKAARKLMPAVSYGGGEYGTAPNADDKTKKNATAKKKAVPKKVDPQVLALEKKYRSQFDRLLTVEIAFIRRACKPDEAQRKIIATEGKRCVADVLRLCAIAQNKMRRRRVAGRNSMPDPRKLLNEHLLGVLKKSLRPEQHEQYRQESERRAASRKQAVVGYMISKADEQLMLSTEQRNLLIKILTKHYQDEWEQYMPIWISNPHLTPTIPNGRILPVLNKHQKSVWRGIPKQGHFFMDMSWTMANVGTVIREKP